MLAIRKAKSLFTVVLTIAIAFATCHAFAEDAYIESDGTSGILTGYKLKPASRVAVDFALTTTEQASGARLFGADRSHTALKMSGSFYIGGGENTLWVIHLGNGEKYDSVWPKDGNGDFITLDTDRHTIVIDYPNPPHLYITGSVTNEVPNKDFTPESFTNEAIEPIALFARQNASGAFEKLCKARIFGVKIYESGALVHDFAPCLKDGMPGFKDIAGDGGFICNPVAETSFTHGGDILVDESAYVATPAGNNTDSDKHLYIDTGYCPAGNMRLELDYALTEAQSSGTWYLFSGTSRFCSYLSGAGIGYGVLSTWGSKSIAKSVSNRPGVRRTTILDIPNKSAMVVTAGYTNDTLAITNTSTYAQTATIKLATIADANNYFASMKIYGCRIYEAGTLVRDFRPYVIGPAQDGSAIVGLKDEVTGTFISYPDATASKRLTCGGKMELPSYVETLRADSRYIDTGYLVTANTKVALDYAVAGERGASDTWYLFGAQGDSTFTALINKNGFGYNNGSWHLSAGMATEASLANVRRTVVLDNPAALGVVTTEGVTNLVTAVDDPTGRTYGTKKTLKLATPHDEKTHFATIRIYGCRIWEKENGGYVLKRDYVPAVENNVAGLRDATGSDTTFRVCASTAASPLTYGGVFTPVVAQTAAKVMHGNTVTLTATAPGATSYSWYRNGEEIPGETSSSLDVLWRRGGETDTYAARSVYAVDAATIESGESESVAVENVTPGLAVIIR